METRCSEPPVIDIKQEVMEECELETPRRSGRFVCDVCGRGFSQRAYLTTHSRVHTGERPYPCEVCKKKFVSKEALRSHSVVHMQERCFDCDLCDKKFRRKQEMQIHRFVHTGERPYVCELCQKAFPRKQTLRKHMLMHTGERPYACDQCDKKFTQKDTLKYHLRRHAGVRPYNCDLCNKSYTSKMQLKGHQKIHPYNLAFRCRVCQRLFWNREIFQKHVRSHSAQFVDDSFQDEQELVSLSKVHDTTNPPRIPPIHRVEEKSVCDQNENGFSNLQDLRSHVLQRFGKKPYYCELCSKKFVDSYYLIRHKRVHTTKKPCPVCHVQYTSRVNFLEHVHCLDDEISCSVKVEMSFEEEHVSDEDSDIS